MVYLLLKYGNTRLDQTKGRNIVASFRVLFSLKYLHFRMLNKLNTFKVHNRSTYVQLQKQRLIRYYSFALTHLETDHHCFSIQSNQSYTNFIYKHIPFILMSIKRNNSTYHVHMPNLFHFCVIVLLFLRYSLLLFELSWIS